MESDVLAIQSTPEFLNLVNSVQPFNGENWIKAVQSIKLPVFSTSQSIKSGLLGIQTFSASFAAPDLNPGHVGGAMAKAIEKWFEFANSEKESDVILLCADHDWQPIGEGIVTWLFDTLMVSFSLPSELDKVAAKSKYSIIDDHKYVVSYSFIAGALKGVSSEKEQQKERNIIIPGNFGQVPRGH